MNVENDKELIPGQRVIVKANHEACMNPGKGSSSDTISVGNPCHAVDKFATVFNVDKTNNTVLVITDFEMICGAENRDRCILKISSVEPLDHRLIFGFVAVNESDKCQSSNCKNDIEYHVFDYLNQREHRLCSTHAIEWLNAQYRAIADVIAGLNKQIKILQANKPV